LAFSALLRPNENRRLPPFFFSAVAGAILAIVGVRECVVDDASKLRGVECEAKGYEV
jgi:hypothetical protein